MMSGGKPTQVPLGDYNIVVSFLGYRNTVLNAHHIVSISSIGLNK